MKYVFPLSLVVAIVIIAAVYVVSFTSHQVSTPIGSTATTTNSHPAASSTAANEVTSSSGYTLAQVATHARASDCWTSINGNVYNVTSWIPLHPGGSEAIIALCGHDGSSVFNAQHGGQRRPTSELAQFYIGPLH